MQFYMALSESSGAQIELGMLQVNVSESFLLICCFVAGQIKSANAVECNMIVINTNPRFL